MTTRVNGGVQPKSPVSDITGKCPLSFPANVILSAFQFSWQTLRYKDICKEREKKEELLAKVTTRERQLRKRIEDLTDPSGRKPNDTTSQIPVKSSNTKLFNGHTKSKGVVTETFKKGKKRKAPAS